MNAGEGLIMNINNLIYPIVAVASLMILHSYASSEIVQLGNQGGYFSGLIQAFMGGYGNTISALIALICSILGITRNLLSAKNGFGSILSGRLIGLVNTLITFIAIFGNGVIIFAKSSDGGEAYTILLGTIIFEIVICAGLILAFFLKPKKPSDN
jgi:hypothetical protein